jgi:mono/diheme cytochrome c family protein
MIPRPEAANVIALVPCSKVLRIALTAAPFLLLPLLTGCDTQSYSPDLKYGPRTDPLLLTTPTAEPKFPDRPGQFPIMTMTMLTLRDSMDKDQAQFQLYEYFQSKKGDVLDPNDTNLLKSKVRKQVDGAIRRMFGTPASPTVHGSENETRLQTDLLLDDTTLAKGSELYRIHCLHCHGLTGDGRGQTSHWINPHPRDYRQGNFKFVSSSQPQGVQKPRRADLMRTIKNGLDGSAMPAFNVLIDEELEAMASYVIHLSLRGQVEFQLLRTVMQEPPSEGEFTPDAADAAAEALLTAFGQNWLEAQKAELTPDPYPFDPSSPKYEDEMQASIKRGYTFFIDTKDGCAKCHVNFGRDSTFRFDAWGTLARPRDLTQGIYRGGRRPLDHYWRVSLGINGGGAATMNPFRDTLKPRGKAEASVWDVVNFVQILPYPAMRAKYGINID